MLFFFASPPKESGCATKKETKKETRQKLPPLPGKP